jgi:hypothetical protein
MGGLRPALTGLAIMPTVGFASRRELSSPHCPVPPRRDQGGKAGGGSDGDSKGARESGDKDATSGMAEL